MFSQMQSRCWLDVVIHPCNAMSAPIMCLVMLYDMVVGCAWSILERKETKSIVRCSSCLLDPSQYFLTETFHWLVPYQLELLWGGRGHHCLLNSTRTWVVWDSFDQVSNQIHDNRMLSELGHVLTAGWPRGIWKHWTHLDMYPKIASAITHHAGNCLHWGHGAFDDWCILILLHRESNYGGLDVALTAEKDLE